MCDLSLRSFLSSLLQEEKLGNNLDATYGTAGKCKGKSVKRAMVLVLSSLAAYWVVVWHLSAEVLAGLWALE
ncbi:hypothetical protein PABY_16090 [Pyrodictium abyssi]|uniref:Uncharacterized protein n=1 Tax=Pyrodictium abyssi TaxID=54256 RepID=A0ABN6ZUJ0_9CREN|nr:hypothetical protein PABY_16090 [Pyrodictium abyssi]